MGLVTETLGLKGHACSTAASILTRCLSWGRGRRGAVAHLLGLSHISCSGQVIGAHASHVLGSLAQLLGRDVWHVPHATHLCLHVQARLMLARSQHEADQILYLAELKCSTPWTAACTSSSSFLCSSLSAALAPTVSLQIAVTTQQ